MNEQERDAFERTVAYARERLVVDTSQESQITACIDSMELQMMGIKP